MKILRQYVGEDSWEEVTLEECLDKTEGSGFWEAGSVQKMLERNIQVFTPFANYKRV